MANNYTINNLIKDSIRCYTGMVAVWPQYNKEEVVNFDVATFNGSYALNNGTLAFVIDNTLYVTPSVRRAHKALEGFKQVYFYVPFSNGDYPKVEQYRWKQLCNIREQLLKESFIQDCIQYSDEQHIGTLDDEILRNCFVMPTMGVKVKHHHFEDTYYPIINDNCFGCTVAERIGTYCANNGKVVFVYRDGRTMIAKGYKIINKLKEQGYKEKGIFVPFSNGESILDPVINSQWNNIQKN